MKWRIPGTVLEIRREDADMIEEVFSSMFLAGGMVLSQVASITGLEPYTVQNWVKRGFLSPPKNKRYSMEQVCRVININMLKNALPMERICSLLTYVNGQLDDNSDDIIKDSDLYFIFVKLAVRARELDNMSQRDEVIDQILENYVEPVPGARERIKEALRVMLIAWVAARMRLAAEAMLDEMNA